MILEIIRASEFVKKEYPKNKPLIEDIIHQNELIILSAKAKSFKSMLTTQMALSCATGASFLDSFDTLKCRVLLVQTEVSEAYLQDRIKMLFSGPVDNFFIAESPKIKIDKEDGIEALRKSIKDYRIDLLILDPLYTLHTGDENSSSDMSRILWELKQLILDLNIACILVHHQGKKFEHSEGKQAGQKHRGSSAFADVPDGSISLNKKDENTIEFSSEFRNRESLEKLNIDFRENKFTLLGKLKKEKDQIEQVILNFLKEKDGKASRTEILDYVEESKVQASERTIDNKLKKLKESRVIRFHKMGKKYVLQDCTHL